MYMYICVYAAFNIPFNIYANIRCLRCYTALYSALNDHVITNCHRGHMILITPIKGLRTMEIIRNK